MTGFTKGFTRVLGWISDLRLAIVLLLVIAIASGVGTAIPQREPAEFYHRLYDPQPWLRLLDGDGVMALQLDHVYSSGWFLGLLAWLALGLSQRLVGYYALHPPHYDSAIAQSIATALKTLIVGMSFLATFSFAFIALGLGLVFVQSLVSGSGSAPAEVDKTA